MSTIKRTTLYLGGLLLLAGSVMPLFQAMQSHAPIVFTIGALLFAIIQIQSGEANDGFVVRRLRAQQKFGALLWVATGCMMFMSKYGVAPCQNDEWKLALAIGAFFQLYTAFRLPAAINKEKEKSQH